jgi:hypothetical protein
MQDFAEILNPGESYFDQRHGLLGAVVDPDNEVLLKITQRSGDLLVGLDLGL